MTPLILCGGYSTRVPFKLFLSQYNGKPVFESAFRLCKEIFGVEPTFLASAETKPMLRRWGAVRIVEDDHSGIINALNPFLSQDDVFVTCGDNLYGESIKRAAITVLDRGQFGAFTGLSLNSELDGWEDAWVPRTINPRMKLISPWILPRGAVKVGSIVELLNIKGILPINVSDPQWTDMGTIESVTRYYSQCE